MSLYKWETLLAGPNTWFNPENKWETGQVLKKTETGYRRDIVEEPKKYIDLIVVGWGWWGWIWTSNASWWWGGWWWVIECRNFKISWNSFNIIVWNWWSWTMNNAWWNWWTSCAFWLCWLWWGGWGWWWANINEKIDEIDDEQVNIERM